MQQPKPLDRSRYERMRQAGFTDDEIRADGFEIPLKDAGNKERTGMGRGLVGALAQLGSNWADETLGAADALGALAHGRGWQTAKDRYRTTQQAVESADNDFREKNPKTSLALSLAGGLVPLGAGAMAAKLPATAAKIALSAPVVGAGMGALTGAGRGADMGERAANAGVGAGVGAAAGAVLGPLAGAAASRFMRSRAGQTLAPKALAAADAVTQKVGLPVRARNPFPAAAKQTATPAADKALQFVVKKLADDGVNPATIEEAVSRFEAGSPELLYNIGGENTRAAMRVLQSYTGPSKQMVQGALDEQSVAVPEMITQGIEQAIGKPIPNFEARVQGLADEASRAAKPHYDALRNQVFDDPDIHDIMKRPALKEALKVAHTNMLNRGKNIPEAQAWNVVLDEAAGVGIPQPGEPYKVHTVGMLDDVKKVLDKQIESIKEKVQAGKASGADKSSIIGLESARDALVERLDALTDGAYAQARGVAKPLIQNREAFREGRSALNQRGDKLAQRVGEMSPEERALMLEGSATDLNERLTSSRDQNAASIFTPKAQRNLGILTKGTPADATIRRTVERASNLQRDVRASTMRGQSTTATTLGGQRDLEEASTAGALEKGLTVADKAIRGSWPSLAADALRAANARYLRGVTEDVATEAAKILTTKLGDGASKKVIADLVRAALVREGMARSIGQGAARASSRGASSAVRPSR